MAVFQLQKYGRSISNLHERETLCVISVSSHVGIHSLYGDLTPHSLSLQFTNGAQLGLLFFIQSSIFPSYNCPLEMFKGNLLSCIMADWQCPIKAKGDRSRRGQLSVQKGVTRPEKNSYLKSQYTKQRIRVSFIEILSLEL